jgi:hypothetical protein
MARAGLAAGLVAGAGFAVAVALAAGFVVALAAGAGFAVAVALSAGAVLVVVVAFVAGAVFVAVAGQLGDGPGPARPAGWSGVQTCSAALVLTLSAVSRSWPIPAKTARNITTGASLIRSLTCGIGMIISP